MFKKILVANRGEAAVRIIRACHELNIEAVAIYSEADADSLHVKLADEAVCVGPPPTKDSYLNMPNVIGAAMITRCDAVHPGWGFFAENADFAEVCEQVGLVFIGPPANVIEQLGNKARARRIMDEAGVPVVPGTRGTIKAGMDVTKVARKFDYPLMVKAAAGGGGKGIRICHNDDELIRGVQLAQAEAKASFGSPEVYIEKFIPEPRHIEVQILADKYGRVIHLWERDCSVQVGHQKRIEETPATRLSKSLRAEITAKAVQAARAVGYVNAGTVEFLLDADGHFYFIEMNTRLQVEHPVTEMTTGVDICKEQIRIAAGEELRWQRHAPPAHGHAIECRLDARDPDNDWAPSPGRITHFVPPGGPGIRVDTHIYAGCEVPPYYDPLLAKIIAYASNREECVARMQRALEELQIEGVTTSLSFLRRVLGNAFFRQGNYTQATFD